MTHELFQDAVTNLLRIVGIHADFTCIPLKGGGNNRAFRIDVKCARFLLKKYFQHPQDPRNRLETEFAFSNFAWKHGLRCLPQPLCCDREHSIGLYEFVEGRPLESADINEHSVRQALTFYVELNQQKQSAAAHALNRASEACFTIVDHMQCVTTRVQRLQRIDESLPIHQEAADFIRNDVVGTWKSIEGRVWKQGMERGISFSTELTKNDRCLSPSDFGFHNAILEENGRLRFLDFEYAGWDDPAKMVCDFFCQPALPVPLRYYEMVVNTVLEDLSEPESHRQRIELLFPVYQLKWICILLNDFLPIDEQRRQFADRENSQDKRKSRQLQKARQALERLVRHRHF